jgi:hypothetical protein
MYALDNWFTTHIDYQPPIVKDRPYYFTAVEKDLSVKRGRSKRFLPMLACKHGHAFVMGGKTFTLTKLTTENNPGVMLKRQILEQLSAGEKEFTLSCDDIDRRFGWPKGATKSFILHDQGFSIEWEAKDIGGGRVRITLKG